MEATARLFLCAACRCQCVICSGCDHGQRYCDQGCAVRARTSTLRAAGKRYQRTRRGRFSHATRQRRCKKVTHHGSAVQPAALSSAHPVPTVATVADPQISTSLRPAITSTIRCHCCGQTCSPSLRRRWLRYGTGTSRSRPPRR